MPKFPRSTLHAIRSTIAAGLRRLVRPDEVVAQKQLLLSYARLRPEERLSFRQVGWGLYSQHDEDGILLYIFGRIGVAHGLAVELCAGDGVECNTANLILNHRWNALLVDGAPRNIARAKSFYAHRVETAHWPPTFRQAWITRDSVNRMVEDAGYKGEVDLLSLDIDGVDYWVWEALTVIDPRVVVLEFNHLHGPEACVSVPYRDDFVAEFTPWGADYSGASLGAFVKLGLRKGYRFVGTNAIGTNAFFVRQDLGRDVLPEASPQDAFGHPRARFGMSVRYAGIKDREWVQV